jgi:hypothetical protein
MLTFEVLLSAARSQQEQENIDPKEVEKAKQKVEKLQDELAQAKRELAELERQVNAYIRKAIDAARVLGIEVPEKYRIAKKNGNSGNGSRSNGKYYWEAYGRKPFTAEISRAMWALSHKSGGSAGDGKGVLTAEEFWNLVKAQTGKKSLAFGEKINIILPNGREITVQRME